MFIVTKIFGKMIEIERKFVFTDNTIAQLLTAGARLVKEMELTDEYYDTDDFKMTLADFWLRRRNGKWQLKCPVAGHSSDAGSHAYGSVYREVDDTDEILELLRPLLNATFTSTNNKNLVNYLGLSRCGIFAAINTRRRSYDLDGFNVDLDCTDSGYQIGEVEVMVPDESHIPEANRRIKSFAEEMGNFKDLCFMRIDALGKPINSMQ